MIYKNQNMGAYLERLHRSPNVDARSWYLALESLTLETLRWRATMQNMYIQTWRSMIESNRATMTQIAESGPVRTVRVRRSDRRLRPLRALLLIELPYFIALNAASTASRSLLVNVNSPSRALVAPV